jgi:hypothetical protein
MIAERRIKSLTANDVNRPSGTGKGYNILGNRISSGRSSSPITTGSTIIFGQLSDFLGKSLILGQTHFCEAFGQSSLNGLAYSQSRLKARLSG